MTNFEREDFENILGRRGVPWDRRDVWEDSFFRYEPGDTDGAIRQTMFVGDPPPFTQEEIEALRLRTVEAGLIEPDAEFVPPAGRPDLIDAAYRLCVRRSRRAPGVIMRRHPVPEADQFLFAEMRPDHPILTGRPNQRNHRGMRSHEKEEHIARSKTSKWHVEEGCTPEELERFSRMRGWGVTKGADHYGVDPGDRTVHVHLSVPKYLFPRNQKKTLRVEHDHLQHSRRNLREHLYQAHDYPRYTYEGSRRRPRDPIVREIFRRTPGSGGRAIERIGPIPPDVLHVHKARVDKTFYARRLSSHPMGFERIAEADRVCFVMEGEIKEAALVVAGEATVSCPSVYLWEAPELPDFTGNYLRGKTVLVIPDSDWRPGVGERRKDDYSVYRQAVRLREALRLYGANNAFIAAPPHPEHCAKGCTKHGVDDHLAHGVTGRRPGTVDQLVWVDVEAPSPGTLDAWYDWKGVRTPKNRLLRSDRVARDEIVLKWLALIAFETGSTKIAVSSLAECALEDLKAQRPDRSLNHGAAKERVKEAIHDMDRDGVISGADDLKYRVEYHLGKTEEWRGVLTIHDPELRARFSTERAVRDIR